MALEVSHREQLEVRVEERTAELSRKTQDINAMLQVLVAAERCAIAGYTAVCNYTAGKDHRTYDLSLGILHEEVEHEAWFSEFLGEGPSGHYRRSGVGSERNSPYTHKFLPH